MFQLYMRGRALRGLMLLLLLLPLTGWAQTPFALSGGNYSQDFADIAN